MGMLYDIGLNYFNITINSSNDPTYPEKRWVDKAYIYI